MSLATDVAGDLGEAVPGPDDGLHPSPAGLQPLPLVGFLPFGHRLEALVELGPDVFWELHLHQAGLVVHLDRGAVLDGLGQVVDVDVVPEDHPGVPVGRLDRRAGEAEEARVGERIAQVPGQAVQQVVLGAVRLVGDDDDVAPLRQAGEGAVGVAFLFGAAELLHGRKDGAPRGSRGDQLA